MYDNSAGCRLTAFAMSPPAIAASSVTTPDALHALLEASGLLLANTPSGDLLSSILDLAASVIAADGYGVWRTTDGVHWHILASRGLPAGYRDTVEAPPGYIPRFESIPDVTASSTVQQYTNLYEQHGIRSLLVVPLQLIDSVPVGTNSGTITFYWRTRRDFSALDIAYASALANLSSAALNLHTLNEQNRRERARLTFLAEASATLASSLDYETTLEQVAKLAVAEIADWCTVHIVENGVPNRIVTAHADPAQLEMAREYAVRYPEQITPSRGVGYVLSTGQAEFIPVVTEEMVQAAARDPEHLDLLRQLRLAGSIVVPLCGHDNVVLGAIRLLAAGDRRFREDDLRLAQDLARRAAAAIENAKLHREVLDQESRLRLAHAAARMGTWSMDLVRGKLFWSEEWKQLHGLAPGTTPDHEIAANLVHPEDRQRVLVELDEALASTDALVVFEHRVVVGDGSIVWIHHRARIERDAGGRAIALVGISMDVTDRRLAEDALRRSEKLAAAGRLAATVAHEINNPLESIVNLIYIALHSEGLSPAVADLLRLAEGELNRTAQIVRQTLGFYRESVLPQDTELGVLVSEVLELYRSRIQARGLQCSQSVESKVVVRIIPGELKQVIANLVSNAIDATAPGGTIAVAVGNADGEATITVSDTGSGIEPGNLGRVFEPFFTTKSDVGTGLGLWVSKGIVEKHHGRLTVNTSTSLHDHGTTFTVRLPLQVPEPVGQAERAEASAATAA